MASKISANTTPVHTCAHLCEYCYANATKQTALNNRHAHLRNPLAETITGA